MDLKALMQKLETINTKQIVTESVETKKVITESVARRVVKESADPVFTSSIARGLVEEFGYDLGEELVSEVAFTPEQQAKMGKANPQDPYIVARVLGKDAVPLSHFTDPEDQKIAKQMGFKDAAAPVVAPGGAATKPAKENPHAGQGGTTPAPALVGTQNQAPDAAAQASRIADRMDAEAGANTAGTQAAKLPTGTVDPNAGEVGGNGAATKPTSTTGKPPAGGAGGDAAVKATREKLTALLDKLEKTGGVTGSAPAPAATAAPAKPSSGGATKQAAPSMSGSQSAGQSVGSAIKSGAQAVGDFAKGTYQGLTKESVTFEDDQTLLAIKNIRF